MRPEILLALAFLALAACSDEASTATASGDAGRDLAGDVSDGAGATDATEDPQTDPADVGGDTADATPDVGLGDTREDGGDAADADPADAADAVPDDVADSDSGDAADTDTQDADPDADLPDGPRGTWQAAAPLARGPRQETAVVALGGEIYVLGGFNDAAAVVPTVEAYDPETNTWRDRADLPVRLHHANAAVVGNNIWIVGFLTGGRFTPDGRIYRYDAAQDSWSEQGRMPEGTDRGASAVGVLRGRIYVAGGLRGGAVSDFSAFDPESGEWETLPPLPRNADHIVGGAVGGVFYAVGGRNRAISTHTAQLWAFDPDVGSWAARPDMPTSRAGHAAAVLDGGLYVFGGEGFPDHPSQVHDHAEVFEPATGRWRVLTPIPTRRHGTGAASLGGRIYLPGGADVIAFNATDANEVFTP